jgi:uncharacterized damage-inducible protein DinB
MSDNTYQSRLQSYSEGRDPLEMQREAPRLLAVLIQDCSPEVLRRSPAKGKWSVAEILAHLADDEVATAWRYRQMIENPGCQLAGFDQDAWAAMGKNAAANPAESLNLFRLLRAANLRLLENLNPEQWDGWGIHAERGRITIRELARHMAGHDMNHVEQIRKILGR